MVLHKDYRHICTWFDMLVQKQTIFLIISEALSGRSIVYTWCAIVCTAPGADGLKCEYIGEYHSCLVCILCRIPLLYTISHISIWCGVMYDEGLSIYILSKEYLNEKCIRFVLPDCESFNVKYSTFQRGMASMNTRDLGPHERTAYIYLSN